VLPGREIDFAPAERLTVHHLVIDRWSRGSSSLHQRDPRAKLAALLVFLIALSTTPPVAQAAFAAYAILLVIAANRARLPILGLTGRAALVLPFSATFALLTWWSGDSLRALALAEKSFLSGTAALLLVATTPLTGWTAALESWRAPRMLILVIQFVYRYLFVIAEQAQRMRWAALCRRGSPKKTRRRWFQFSAAAGLTGVLFARSWQRADGIYHAMLARGFRGRFVPAAPAPFRTSDAIFFSACLAGCLAIRILL
jgi:cobalt/nickel transport system permease protein